MAQLRTLVRSAGGDDTAALQAALDAVGAAGGGEVLLAPGDFGYSDNLVVRARTTLRAQGGARLVARNPERSSVFLEGADVAVREVTIVGNAQGRSSSDRAMGLRGGGCTGLTIDGVTVRAVAGGGILLRDCAGFRITGCLIEDTFADGIHLTERSRQGIVSGNRCLATGDDGIACVGYQKDGDVVSHVAITGNLVAGGKARGIACLGAHHVSIAGNVITGMAAAGIYLAQENNYQTYAPRFVAVTGNVLSDVSKRVGHAGIFVRGGEGTRPTRDGRRLEDAIVGVTLVGNLLDGSGNDGVLVGDDVRAVAGGANLAVAVARRRAVLGRRAGSVEVGGGE
jgi:hypothetical protein